MLPPNVRVLLPAELLKMVAPSSVRGALIVSAAVPVTEFVIVLLALRSKTFPAVDPIVYPDVPAPLKVMLPISCVV
jgi:hypothetical protein